MKTIYYLAFQVVSLETELLGAILSPETGVIWIPRFAARLAMTIVNFNTKVIFTLIFDRNGKRECHVF